MKRDPDEEKEFYFVVLSLTTILIFTFIMVGFTFLKLGWQRH